MTDERTKIRQAVDRVLASIKAASESYIGAPVTREIMETASSKAMGFPVRFPYWDETTGTATKMVIDLPPLDLDVEAAARSREKTRALLDTIVTKMEVVHTPPDAPRLESTWTCEIEDSSEVVGLPDNGDE